MKRLDPLRAKKIFIRKNWAIPRFRLLKPISLTSVPGKIMEQLIRDKLVDHMTSNNLFNNTQHGFVSGRSCITQLFEYIEDLTESIDNGEDVDVIYLDFCKAFDKVPHRSLVYKLDQYGIKGDLLLWINLYGLTFSMTGSKE